MRFRYLHAALLTIAAMTTANAVGATKEITVLYAVNPPLMCEKDGELDCVAGQLLKRAAKAGGFSLKLMPLPWARALEALDTTANAIFAAQPIPDGPAPTVGTKLAAVWTDDVFIWTLDDKKINSDADIAKLNTVAVRRGTPFATYLTRKQATAKIVETNDWVQAAQMLDAGRVDALTLTGQVGKVNIVDGAKIAAARLNKYKVGELTFWVMSGSKPSADVAEFAKAIAVEKGKPEFLGELKTMGVRP